MSEHRNRINGVGYSVAWAEYQGLLIHATLLEAPRSHMVVSVQGREDDAGGGACATWDSPSYPSGSEACDLGTGWIDGDVPSEVYLDWLRENDTTGELESLLEGELKCTA